MTEIIGARYHISSNFSISKIYLYQSMSHQFLKVALFAAREGEETLE